MTAIIKFLFALIIIIFLIDLSSSDDAVDLNQISSTESTIKENKNTSNIIIFDQNFAYRTTDEITKKLNLNLNECNRLNEIVGSYVREQVQIFQKEQSVFKAWSDNNETSNALKQQKADLVDEYFFYANEYIKLYAVIDITLNQYPECFDADIHYSKNENGYIWNNPDINMYRSIQRTKELLVDSRSYYADRIFYMQRNTEYESLINRTIDFGETRDR